MKKEAVGNSGEKMLREQGVPCEKRLEIAVEREKRDCEKFWEKEAAGTRGPSEKKMLWEILGKESFREQGVPCEKRGCGKLWGKETAGTKGSL